MVDTSFANPDPAGTVGAVTVTAMDKYDNVVGHGPNQYEGTVDLVMTDSQATGPPASHTFTAADAGSYNLHRRGPEDGGETRRSRSSTP